MSFYNQRGIFLQLLAPSIVNPQEARVSMQLARKQSGWDPVEEANIETLVDSVMIEAISSDGGQTFTIKSAGHDVDGDRDIDLDDKQKLLALAQAYVSIRNP